MNWEGIQLETLFPLIKEHRHVLPNYWSSLITLNIFFNLLLLLVAEKKCLFRINLVPQQTVLISKFSVLFQLWEQLLRLWDQIGVLQLNHKLKALM